MVKKYFVSVKVKIQGNGPRPAIIIQQRPHYYLSLPFCRCVQRIYIHAGLEDVDWLGGLSHMSVIDPNLGMYIQGVASFTQFEKFSLIRGSL